MSVARPGNFPSSLSRRAFLKVVGLTAGAALLPGCSRSPVPTEGVSTPLPGETAPRLWQVSGVRVPQLGHLDAAIKGFMQRRSIACGAAAVVWQGRLVMAHGYRWSPEGEFQPEPTTLFRLAELSQPFTAMAVLRLVQDGFLKLETRLTDVIPQLSQIQGWSEITVRHLLHHQVNWQFPNGADPLFSDRLIARVLDVPLPISLDQVWQFLLEQPPNPQPGIAYTLHHLDYVLLGEVITQVTGIGYEEYLQDQVFTPCGMSGVLLGHTARGQQHPGEAPYHSNRQVISVIDEDKLVEPPYGGFNLENLAASAGWVASVFEMGRWLCALDNWETHPVLNRQSLELMFAPSKELASTSTGWRPGCGWLVRGAGAYQEYWRVGSLPGVYAQMGRLPEGWAYVAIFNQNEDPGDPTGGSYADLSWVIEDALRLTTEPPPGDLLSF